jgi:peroxiredoxin
VKKVLGVVALGVAAGSAAEAAALSLGEAAPMATVKMKSVDGRELSIADVAGAKGTLVMFSCNHCPYVKAWEDRIASIGNGAPARGVGVIVINANDPEAYPEDDYAAMQKRAQEKGFEFPYVVDATSDVARAFGATRTPEVYLFDAAGKLAYRGAIDDNAQDAAKAQRRYLADAIDALAAGREVAERETKAIGCSIKFRPAR